MSTDPAAAVAPLLPLNAAPWAVNKTPVVITYLHGLAPDELIEEVPGGVSAIDVDGCGYQLYRGVIEDTPYTVFPQILNTERPTWWWPTS